MSDWTKEQKAELASLYQAGKLYNELNRVRKELASREAECAALKIKNEELQEVASGQAALVERLRVRVIQQAHYDPSLPLKVKWTTIPDPDCQEAAAIIASLSRAEGEMREKCAKADYRLVILKAISDIPVHNSAYISAAQEVLRSTLSRSLLERIADEASNAVTTAIRALPLSTASDT